MAILANQGECVVYDLGPMAVELYDAITGHIGHACDYETDYRYAVQQCYETVIFELVYLLNEPPTEAIERIKYIPSSKRYREFIILFGLKELDILKHICTTYCLSIYQRIRQQTGIIFNHTCVPVRAGQDYVVIRIAGHPFHLEYQNVWSPDPHVSRR